MTGFQFALILFALTTYIGWRMEDAAHGSDVIGWPLITCVAGAFGLFCTLVYGILDWML